MKCLWGRIDVESKSTMIRERSEVKNQDDVVKSRHEMLRIGLMVFRERVKDRVILT